MQQEQFEKQTLINKNKDNFTDNRAKQPAPLRTPRRPYKGIFLTFFLWFTGMLFFVHGFHRFEEYSTWDLISVWVLSILLMIPGSYFGMIVFAVETGTSGFCYKNHPELYH